MKVQQIKDKIDIILEHENVSVQAYKEIQSAVNTLIEEILHREQKLQELNEE